jgi:hypothetical protein
VLEACAPGSVTTAAAQTGNSKITVSLPADSNGSVVSIGERGDFSIGDLQFELPGAGL